MKVIFEAEDTVEIKRLSKSTDMALFIYNLVFNSRDYINQKELDYIHDLLSKHNIIIDDIIE